MTNRDLLMPLVELEQEAQLSQRGRATLRAGETLAVTQDRSTSFKITPQAVCKLILVFHRNYVYIVPFLRYSTSNNAVTLNSGYGSFKVSESGTS